MQGGPSDSIPSLRTEVSKLLVKEERMWRQRSRTQWLKHGDRNTNFFHSRATHRQRRNAIVGLRDSDCEWRTDPDQVQTMLTSYFQDIFLTSNPSSIDTVFQCVPTMITESMNESLSRPYTAQEVETALRQMAPQTAPGPDGLPPVFYQSHWHLIGNDVIRGVLSSLNSGKLVCSINHTNITLIPKVKNPEKVSEFRPISLCNVLYKIISKVVANRLKMILPHMISETQSAFVPGRLITDNILVAFETLHHMQTTRHGRQGHMALKLDMCKAYDRVEWAFLASLMGKMGFNTKFIALIIECISTVSYSILINGIPHGNFTPTRGIRQGDPLSPYLFILCAEGLHYLLKKAQLAGSISGVSLCRLGPEITHLYFVDDSLLFCRATREECQTIQDILSL